MTHLPQRLYKNEGPVKLTGMTKVLFVMRWIFLGLALIILLTLGYYRLTHARILSADKVPKDQAFRAIPTPVTDLETRSL